jgi:hypothetical protein
VVREVVGKGGEMTQALYAHMNKIKIKKKKSATEAQGPPSLLPALCLPSQPLSWGHCMGFPPAPGF